MREFNLLSGYPPPAQPRLVGPGVRTIHNRINASYRDQRYYDGERNDGYGGYRYDGRWVPFAQRIVQEYGLAEDAALLQIGCEKGFLLHDLHQLYPQMRLAGYEMSRYAIDHAMETVKGRIRHGRFHQLPYSDGEFDFVLATGVVYTLTLADAIACLKEIQRVGQGRSFITLGAYRDEREERLFRWWTVLGTTILHVDDWRAVLEHAGYTGDYAFATAESLNLVEAER